MSQKGSKAFTVLSLMIQIYGLIVCISKCYEKWNVTPLIWMGINFSSLQQFIAPALDLMPCLPSQWSLQRRGNKGIKFKEGSPNSNSAVTNLGVLSVLLNLGVAKKANISFFSNAPELHICNNTTYIYSLSVPGFKPGTQTTTICQKFML